MSDRIKEAGRKYTYEDYMTWNDDKRWEIIEGVPYCMTPGPTWVHQGILGDLYVQFANFLRGKSCRVFMSPFDVRLNFGKEDRKSETVVQPDLVVVCDRFKLKGTGCVGAPDLVVEVVSPSSAKRDRLLKFNQYEKAGVKEYWIVDPIEKIVTIFQLGIDHKYGRPDIYAEDAKIQVGIFPELTIDMQSVFENNQELE